MDLLVVIFGALILLAGVVILINPEILFGYLRSNLNRLAVHILAVMVRLIIGALLVNQSSLSKFPLTIEILGWISIAAALFLAAIGRQKFLRLMSWALTNLKPYGRIGGGLASAFGGFIVYAFV